MNEVFVLALVLVSVLSYVALVTLLATFLPRLTQRGRQVVADSPVWTILVGAIGWAIFGALAFWLYAKAEFDRLFETATEPAYLVAACIAVIVPSLVCLLGAPGLYMQIGSRIAMLRQRESSEFWCVAVGALVSLTAALFPFVGWFLVLPLLLAAEFGTGFRSLLR